MLKNIIGTTLLTICFTACTSTKQKATNNNSEIAQKQNTETSIGITSSDSQISGGAVAKANGATGAMNNLQANAQHNQIITSGDSQLFSHLDMTEEQINSYKSAIENFESQKRNMPNGEMLGSFESERSRQMKNILSDEQFIRYEKWVAENE
ncbi:hypothetical protein [Zobellia sp. 1_MG-2023]|uniref:hypothetical protein n=1 Tax=Zobellia sp. 1_MG-2023 TaxID=3062626 RepID=UPI0026E33897|nr:hypothetical protein [Zobellia sp. 1_MG-2023]MDO6820894.1 hypothetical protein [Zobellia sp. 1_MG-2023]